MSAFMARDKPPYYTAALKEFISGMSQSEVNEFALTCGTTGGHLRNCANGSRGVSPKLAAQIEVVTNKKLRRKELREDWEEIWPELAKKGRK